MDDPTNQVFAYKFRTYNLGIPIGELKSVILDDKFLFLGYELEIPIHYKQKTFINEDKEDKDDYLV